MVAEAGRRAPRGAGRRRRGKHRAAGRWQRVGAGDRPGAGSGPGTAPRAPVGVHMCVCVYIYTHLLSAREGERRKRGPSVPAGAAGRVWAAAGAGVLRRGGGCGRLGPACQEAPRGSFLTRCRVLWQCHNMRSQRDEESGYFCPLCAKTKR